MYLEKYLPPVYMHIFINLQELIKEEINNLQYLHEIKNLYLPVETIPLTQIIRNLITLRAI